MGHTLASIHTKVGSRYQKYENVSNSMCAHTYTHIHTHAHTHTHMHAYMDILALRKFVTVMFFIQSDSKIFLKTLEAVTSLQNKEKSSYTYVH